jgi:large subunit ribosomal protein L31
VPPRCDTHVRRFGWRKSLSDQELSVKAKIHPRYQTCTVHCACGNNFTTRSTIGRINVDICSVCHPFFTGKQKFIDTSGRVERFSKKFGGTYSFQKAAPAAPAKK